MESTSSGKIQGANITMSNRLSSNVSVASVSSYATVKASNRDIKVQQKIENITDSEEACFAAMWLCINKPQQVALPAQLARLIMQNISAEERNDTMSFIDHLLHMNHLTDAQNDTVDTFMTLLRGLAAPGVRDLHLLAYRACVIMDNSVATPPDATMHTVDDLSAGARSRDSGITTTESVGASHTTGSFPAIFFENLGEVQVVAEGHGLPLGSFGTLSDSNPNVDCTGPPETFFGNGGGSL